MRDSLSPKESATALVMFFFRRIGRFGRHVRVGQGSEGEA